MLQRITETNRRITRRDMTASTIGSWEIVVVRIDASSRVGKGMKSGPDDPGEYPNTRPESRQLHRRWCPLQVRKFVRAKHVYALRALWFGAGSAWWLGRRFAHILSEEVASDRTEQTDYWRQLVIAEPHDQQYR